MTGQEHNKIVDDAWQNTVDSKERLIASQQVLDLYARNAWGNLLTRLTCALCITAIGITLLVVLGGRL